MRSPAVPPVLYWAPRVLTILLAALFSIFALDVFGMHLGIWGTIVGLFMHLVPTWLVLIILALAWRTEWLGAIAYIGLALWYFVWAWERMHWSAIAIISGSLLLIGLLFLANWVLRRPLPARPA